MEKPPGQPYDVSQLCGPVWAIHDPSLFLDAQLALSSASSLDNRFACSRLG